MVESIYSLQVVSEVIGIHRVLLFINLTMKINDFVPTFLFQIVTMILLRSFATNTNAPKSQQYFSRFEEVSIFSTCVFLWMFLVIG